MNSTQRDEGAGVPYQVQYSITPEGGRQALDRGHRPLVRRRGGQAGARARRHPRHQRAARAGREALLPVALRRPDRRNESLASHRGAGDDAAAGGRPAQLLRPADDRDRQSCPPQRSLWLRRRRRGDRRGRQAAARQDARRRPSRPLLRQQVRRDPQQLHAGRHGEGVRAPAGRRARRRGPHARRAGCRHRHDRRRHRAAPCPHRAGNLRPRAGGAQQRQGQAPRLVPGLSPERRARRDAPRERACGRRDRQRAQRAAHPARLRAGGRCAHPRDGVP